MAMAKASEKAKKRLEERIRVFEAQKLTTVRGFRKPGSLKK